MNDLAAGKSPQPLVSDASLKLSSGTQKVEYTEEDEDLIFDEPNLDIDSDEEPLDVDISSIRGPNVTRPNAPPIQVDWTGLLPRDDLSSVVNLSEAVNQQPTRRGWDIH